MTFYQNPKYEGIGNRRIIDAVYLGWQFSAFSAHQNHLEEDLVEHRLLRFQPQSFSFSRAGMSLENVFLKGFRVMLMLLLQGPCFENHVYRSSQRNLSGSSQGFMHIFVNIKEILIYMKRIWWLTLHAKFSSFRDCMVGESSRLITFSSFILLPFDDFQFYSYLIPMEESSYANPCISLINR